MTATPRTAGLLTAWAAFAALAVAYWSQDFLHLVPCPLCLIERIPYRFVIALGLLAVFTPPRFARIFLSLAALCLAAAAAVAFIHIGVEFHFWPSPLPECNGILTQGAPLPLTPSKSCDAATYLIPGLPLSMAAMDFLYALAFAIAISAYLISARRRRL